MSSLSQTKFVYVCALHGRTRTHTDAEEILVSCREKDEQHLYRISAGGERCKALAPGQHFAFSQTCSPDGARTHQYDLRATDCDGGNAQKVT